MNNRHLCETCGRSFSLPGNLRRHRQTAHNPVQRPCHLCGRVMTRSDSFRRHMMDVHGVQPAAAPGPQPPPQQPQRGGDQACRLCPLTFGSHEFLQHHMFMEHAVSPAASISSTSTTSSTGSNRSVGCDQCPRRFKRSADLQRHVRTIRGQRFHCDECGATYRREGYLRLHIEREHGEDAGRRFRCAYCDRGFARRYNRDQHEAHSCPIVNNLVHGELPPAQTPQPGPSTAAEPRPGPSTEPQSGPSTTAAAAAESMDIAVSPVFELVERTFRGRLLTYSLTRPMEVLITMEEALSLLFEDILNLLVGVMTRHPSIKVNLFLECEFGNVHGAICARAFKTKNVALTEGYDLEEFLSAAFSKLVGEKEKCEMTGSGRTYLRVKGLQIRVNEYTPLGEDKGRAYIPLPKAISETRAVVNVHNTDDRCFMYAMLAKFVPHHEERVATYTPDILARYDWTCVPFPVHVKNIKTFERVNNDSVNVYAVNREMVDRRRDGSPIFKDKVYPLKICRQELDDHRDLLYVTTEDGNNHYAYIRDLSRLVRTQLTNRGHRLHICKRCFAYFNDQPNKLGLMGAERLEEHKRYCYANAPIRLDMPKKEKIRFTHPEYTRRERFCIYADFEYALQPATDDNAANAPRGVRPINVHVPYAFAYQIIDSLAQVEFDPRVYFGDDASKVFMEWLKTDVTMLWGYLFNAKALRPVLTLQEHITYFLATDCYLCGKAFSEADLKVRDHNVAPPYEFRGAAHRSCNLRYREQRLINCYFHNLSNYDAHFIVRELAIDAGDVGVLAHTEERYIAFTKRFEFGQRESFTVRFLDSYRFLSSSLAGLAAALPSDRMRQTRKRFPDDQLFDLVRRKGVFPYDFVTSLDVMYATRKLPPKEAFYNKLTLEHITDADYEHARNVWRVFQGSNLKDYGDIYLHCDISLLTDVFEQFRDTSLIEYGLDPAHYYTLLAYAWDAMLKTTDVELDTLQDFDMYLFVEQGIRGGVSQAIARYAKANHERCRQVDQRPDEPKRHLLYVDANNLYGWAMSQCLPTGDFQWLSREEIDALDITSLDAEAERGYILEVDLHYPEHLHDQHKDLPYCCETKRPPIGKHPKLITTLDDKHHYICHHRILQQALENGLELTAVHRAISFRQSRWLEPYILMNTDLRKKATTKFEQDYFKLMNNAVFGKTIENVRKRLNVKLVCTPKKFRKFVSKLNFLNRTYYTDDVALVHLTKVNIVLEKPVYVGMFVMELSKWLMYDFLRKMKNRYGVRLEVDYMDTDSFVFDILSDNIYRDMREHLDDFDTSAYPQNHPCYSPTYAKVISKFKDEANGHAVLEYLGLRSKLYFMDIADNDDVDDNAPAQRVKTVKRAKGVARGVVKNILTAEDYRDCLFNGVLKSTVNTRFQSHLHRVYTVQVEKLSLCPADDKCYILADGIHTLPWGHKDIPPIPGAGVQQPPPPPDSDDEDFDV